MIYLAEVVNAMSRSGWLIGQRRQEGSWITVECENVEYLKEEYWLLRERLGGQRLRFTDAERNLYSLRECFFVVEKNEG